MDAFGTTVFTGGVVLVLGSFFTEIFHPAKERSAKKYSSKKYSSKPVIDKSLGASPMQVLVGGSLF
jgi:hypothetical protein